MIFLLVNNFIFVLVIYLILKIGKYFSDDDEQSKIIELIIQIVKERTRLVSTYGGVKTFDILPVQRYKDKFSIWEYDPLADQMKIFVELHNHEPFSRYWKLSENVTKKYIKKL
jgi:hypothetical protein